MKFSKKRKRVKKNKVGIKICLYLISVVCILLFLIYLWWNIDFSNFVKDNGYKTMYLASANNQVSVFTLEEQISDVNREVVKILVESKKILRGKKVSVVDSSIEYEDKLYYLVKLDKEEYYVNNINLVLEADEVVLEKNIYVRNSTSILATDGSKKIVGLAKKGEELEVVGYDKINNDGYVNVYTVSDGEKRGLVYGKYMSFTKDESQLNYMADIYDPIHSKIKNNYGGGEAIGLDFYPNKKQEFDENKMPDSVYALYLNCDSSIIGNIDEYIDFAKTTKINSFVVDIKDNESPAFPAKTFKLLSPTSYENAVNSYDSYKNAIIKLREAGFYVIGRITVFKDSYYVQDNKEVAILNKNTGEPYLHNGSYWPSAYNRDVWYYNLLLAREAVEEFGFNEINFDYVRFPDRMNSVSNIIDLKNIYDESKVQAIQRFIQYAKDILHELNVYVSVDVFGETTNGTYTTAYGQYWPAISNEVDVISGMPYPDHFSSGYYGLAKPWNEPYKLMNYWGRYALDRQKEIPTPAKVRTWIQAYDVMKYVDNNGISYGAKQVEDQIRGLYDAGVTDGYITWLSNSDLMKYKSQASAFSIDYWKEYEKKNG